jgi:hypothetical protein
MTNISSASGTAKLTTYGKRTVAESMYQKGRSFIGAALLLRRQGGYEYVVLHLLCQGVEIVLKSLLLHRSYDKYISRIRTPIGHDLERAADAVVAEFGRRKLSQELLLELRALNALYKRHLLRYGSGYDLLVNPETISSERVLTKIVRVIRIADRYITW